MSNKREHIKAFFASGVIVLGLVFAMGPGSGRAAEDSTRLDSATTVTLESTVRKAEWDGPHVRFELDVADGNGGLLPWIVEGPAVAQLEAGGWSTHSVNAGDKVDVVVHPDKAGAAFGSLVRVILADGRTLELNPKDNSPTIPADGAIGGVLTQPSSDPVAGYYGNTVECAGEDFECHAWFSADPSDHHLIMFARDRKKDGSWSFHGVEGVWWVEKLQNTYFMCMSFPHRMAPICHSTVNFEKVGDQWTAKLPGGARDSKRLVSGHE